MSTTNDLPKSDERAIAVRLRDNERCTICNRAASQTELQVHTIVPGDGPASMKLSNYVLLCEEHHRKAHQEDASK